MTEPGKSFMKRFHDGSPRLWALSIFPIILIVTIVGLPISYVADICADVPRVVRNLLSDVSGWGRPFFKRAAYWYVIAWKAFWRALCGKGKNQ